MIRSFKNSTIIAKSPKTFLEADYNTGVTVLKVANSQYVAGYNYIVLEGIPSEKFEILKISSNSNDTITVSSATRYPHTFQTPIYFTKSNKIEFSHANDLTEAKTVLAEMAIAGSEEYTRYSDDVNATGFGFIRLFADEVVKVYEGYSPPNPYSYDRYTARELKQSALEMLNKEYSMDVIKDSFIYRQINACESYVTNAKGKGNWSFLVKKDALLGVLAEGQWSLPIPSDIQDPNTNESIEVLSINRPLRYMDNEAWRQLTYGIEATITTAQASIGATEILVSSTVGFPEEGTLKVGSQVIEYTGITDTSFTGVTGVTEVIPTGETLFYNVSYGNPQMYTVKNGKVYVYPVPLEVNAGPVYITYKRKASNITNSYSRTIIPDETAVIDYLCAKIQQRLNDGMVDNTVRDFMDSFNQKVVRMLRYDKTGRERKFTHRFTKVINRPIRHKEYGE